MTTAETHDPPSGRPPSFSPGARHCGADLQSAELIVYGVHGRDQSPDFIEQTAQRIGELDRLHWVMPAAPGRTWYPGRFLEPVEENQPELDRSLLTVGRDLELLLGAGPPVVVLGFSQGACLLAEHVLTQWPALSGAVLHTGGYMGPAPRRFPPAPEEPAPVLVLTADEDPWVPLERVEQTVVAFSAAGAEVQSVVYADREHHINEDSIDRIRSFLDPLVGQGER